MDSSLKPRKFEVVADYEPAGDQGEAIELLAAGIESGFERQTLKGVTGSGKTFTMAKIIEKVQRPTLVLSHNKTLAAQLFREFKSFFPTMRWVTSSPLTTTTNPKPMSPVKTSILRKMRQSMMKLIVCASMPPTPSWSVGT